MANIESIKQKILQLDAGSFQNLCDSYLYKGSVRHNLSDYAEWIRTNNEHMANEALRVLAFAYKEIDHVPSKYEMENLESVLMTYFYDI